MQLQGRTFLVSGGSSGLGAACVTEFAGAGANVVIADISERGEELARELGGNVRFVKTDVTDSNQVQNAVNTAAREFGGLQGAICCAGIATAERVIGREGPLPLERFAKVITVNLIGTFNVIRLAGAKMIERPSSRERIAASSSARPRSPPTTARLGKPPTRPRKAESLGSRCRSRASSRSTKFASAASRRDLRYAAARGAARGGARVARQAGSVPVAPGPAGRIRPPCSAHRRESNAQR